MDLDKIVVNATKVTEKLWIGNQASAHSVEFLQKNNIKLIVNCTKHIPFVRTKGVFHIRLPVNDPADITTLEHPDAKMWVDNIDSVLEIIHYYTHSLGVNVLVHCHRGMQRSASVVTAYVMRFIMEKNLSESEKLSTAIGDLVTRRKIAYNAGRNVNFIVPLKYYVKNL